MYTMCTTDTYTHTATHTSTHIHLFTKLGSLALQIKQIGQFGFNFGFSQWTAIVATYRQFIHMF